MEYLNEKLVKEEKKARSSMKAGKLAANLWMIVFFASLILLFAGKKTIVLCIISFLMIGFGQMGYDKAKKTFDLLQNYKLYSEKLQGKGKVSIDEMSALVWQETNAVLKNLDEMIRMGYITRVQSNGFYGRIAYIHDTAIELNDGSKNMMAVTCSACGGVTHVPKDCACVCESCGSKIEA